MEKKKPRILIIEDDEYSLEAIEHLLDGSRLLVAEDRRIAPKGSVRDKLHLQSRSVSVAI